MASMVFSRLPELAWWFLPVDSYAVTGRWPLSLELSEAPSGRMSELASHSYAWCFASPWPFSLYVAWFSDSGMVSG